MVDLFEILSAILKLLIILNNKIKIGIYPVGVKIIIINK